ncbi:hypothetical protein T02_14164 [Trichinella nativa]|uniref:Uncharacterized protein n=1 Tax=Trichinella nativa TaxID=6335 RepID=A0A0V1KXD7_9BILA|nr:hypothetical protein T02_14164 [Trichinella nativa]
MFYTQSATGSFWKLIVQVYHFWFHERFSMAHLTSNDKSVIDGDDDRLAFVKQNCEIDFTTSVEKTLKKKNVIDKSIRQIFITNVD